MLVFPSNLLSMLYFILSVCSLSFPKQSKSTSKKKKRKKAWTLALLCTILYHLIVCSSQSSCCCILLHRRLFFHIYAESRAQTFCNDLWLWITSSCYNEKHVKGRCHLYLPFPTCSGSIRVHLNLTHLQILIAFLTADMEGGGGKGSVSVFASVLASKTEDVC